MRSASDELRHFLEERRAGRPLAPAVEKAIAARRVSFDSAKSDSGLNRFEFVVMLMVNGCDPRLIARLAEAGKFDAADTMSIMKRACNGRFEGVQIPQAIDLATGVGLGLGKDWAHEDAVEEAFAVLRPLARMESRGGKAGTRRGNGAGSAVLERRVSYKAARDYFEHHFPWELVMRLLHRRDSPVGLREFRGEVYQHRPNLLANKPILSVEHLRHLTIHRGIVGLHVSKAYDARDQEHRSGKDAPLGVELVLEIDDVPEIGRNRTKGMPSTWTFPSSAADAWKKAAMGAVLDVLAALGETLHLLFHSGGKSPHLWLLSEQVRAHTAAQRRAFCARICKPWLQEDAHLYDAWLAAMNKWILPVYDALDDTERMPEETTLEVLWPVFDANVLNPAQNHRLPLVPHAKTGRLGYVCASPAELPDGEDDVPTLNDAAAVVAKGSDVLRRLLQETRRGEAHDPPEAVVPLVLRASFVNRESGDDETTAEPGRPPLQILPEGVAAHGDLPIAGFYVDLVAARAWIDALEQAATKTRTDELHDPRIAAMAARATAQRTHWPLSLAGHALRLRKRLVAPLSRLGVDRLLLRQVAVETVGRAVVRCPDLNRSNVVLGMSNESRVAVSGDVYDELDISGCHLSIAWSSMVHKHGSVEARRLAPELGLAATSRPAAVDRIHSQLGRVSGTVSRAEAKTLLYTALNKESPHSQPCAFLRRITELRGPVLEALLEEPCVAEVATELRAGSTKETSLLAKCMQRVEGVLVNMLARHLDDAGVEVACYENDAVRCRIPSGCAADYEDLIRTATASMVERHHMNIRIEVKHRATAALDDAGSLPTSQRVAHSPQGDAPTATDAVYQPPPCPVDLAPPCPADDQADDHERGAPKRPRDDAPHPSEKRPRYMPSPELRTLVDEGEIELVTTAHGGKTGCVVVTAVCGRDVSWKHRELLRREGFAYSTQRCRNVKIVMDNRTALLSLVASGGVVAQLRTEPETTRPLSIWVDVRDDRIFRKLQRAGFTRGEGKGLYRGAPRMMPGLKEKHLMANGAATGMSHEPQPVA